MYYLYNDLTVNLIKIAFRLNSDKQEYSRNLLNLT